MRIVVILIGLIAAYLCGDWAMWIGIDIGDYLNSDLVVFSLNSWQYTG
jgi:hypothetical protein